MKAIAPAAVILLSLVGPVCLGQTQLSEEDAAKDPGRTCERVLCRDATTVRVLQEDGSTLEVSLPARLPFVQPNGWITIFPGEEIFIEVDVEGDRVSNPRAVRNTESPTTTLTFKFWQAPNRKDSFLLIANPFPRPVKFNLGMRPVPEERLRKTTSCPVLAGRTQVEHWPHPIVQLVIANIRFLPEGAERKCEF
jgi:hypothetical protein